MDERAHEGERAASDEEPRAEPMLRSVPSSPEEETFRQPARQIAPPEPVATLVLQLPRAAGGGAGAVAAPVFFADEPASGLAHAAAPVRADPPPAALAPEAPLGHSPDSLAEPVAATPAADPMTEVAAPADAERVHEPVVLESAQDASPAPKEDTERQAEATALLVIEPADPQHAEASQPADPGPRFPPPTETASPIESAEQTALIEDAASDEPEHLSIAPAHDPGAEKPEPLPLVPHADEAIALPSPAADAPEPLPLVERIPRVLPAPPKLAALSPSAAPVLRPIQIAPMFDRAPDARAVEPAPPIELRPPPPRPPPPPEPTPFAPPPTDGVLLPTPGPAVPLPFPSHPQQTTGRTRLRLALRATLALLVAGVGLLLVLLVLYRWVDPPASTLMIGQRLSGTPIVQRWIPLERMSPNLSAAVISSEDGHFCRHRGVDWGELKEAIESSGDGIARGGSTISMQVVKNLFLWPSRSYLRKALEIPLAYAMEALWPKRRILEIYLNIAEWGPGIFGAEAAARYHFRKPALLLTPREAALLAVSLPNPFERQAGRPGPGTLRLADNLLMRMRAAQANLACVRAGQDARATRG